MFLIDAKNLSIRRRGRFNFLTRAPILHREKVAEKEVSVLQTNYFRIYSITRWF